MKKPRKSTSIAIGASALSLFVGIGIGASGGGQAPPAAIAPTRNVTKTVEVPGPTKTVQADANPRATKTVKVKVPGPTVTVIAKAAAPKRQPKVAPRVDTSGATTSQANAISSAEDYLSISGFSRSGLIKQLSSKYGDGYSVGDATYAVDHLTVDWNQQAVRSAKQYLDMSGFSRSGLIKQLSSKYGDGYTLAQATYAADKVGL